MKFVVMFIYSKPGSNYVDTSVTKRSLSPYIEGTSPKKIILVSYGIPHSSSEALK